MQQSIVMSLPETSLELLIADGGASEADLSRCLVVAVAYFLKQRGADAPGHSYPELQRGKRVEPARRLQLTIDSELWERFVEEAESQRVSPDQLLEHAALYFAAQRDSGRIAEQIARGL